MGSLFLWWPEASYVRAVLVARAKKNDSLLVLCQRWNNV